MAAGRILNFKIGIEWAKPYVAVLPLAIAVVGIITYLSGLGGTQTVLARDLASMNSRVQTVEQQQARSAEAFVRIERTERDVSSIATKVDEANRTLGDVRVLLERALIAQQRNPK